MFLHCVPQLALAQSSAEPRSNSRSSTSTDPFQQVASKSGGQRLTDWLTDRLMEETQRKERRLIPPLSKLSPQQCPPPPPHHPPPPHTLTPSGGSASPSKPRGSTTNARKLKRSAGALIKPLVSTHLLVPLLSPQHTRHFHKPSEDQQQPSTTTATTIKSSTSSPKRKKERKTHISYWPVAVVAISFEGFVETRKEKKRMRQKEETSAVALRDVFTPRRSFAAAAADESYMCHPFHFTVFSLFNFIFCFFSFFFNFFFFK